MKEHYTMDEFLEVVRRLRADDGCPWDREQTHESLKKCLKDECEEVIEAIDNNDYENLLEELGDILLQLVMHSQIATEEGKFNFDDVVTNVSRKMIRRHPHVFGKEESETGDATTWEEIKALEKELKKKTPQIPKNP